MPLTKEHIVDSFGRKSNLSQSTSTEILEALLETIKRTLANGEDVPISGLGKFCVRAKKARKGRNPRTGQDMMLRPR